LECKYAHTLFTKIKYIALYALSVADLGGFQGFYGNPFGKMHILHPINVWTGVSYFTISRSREGGSERLLSAISVQH